jgi:hypothetical protein
MLPSSFQHKRIFRPVIRPESTAFDALCDGAKRPVPVAQRYQVSDARVEPQLVDHRNQSLSRAVNDADE